MPTVADIARLLDADIPEGAAGVDVDGPAPLESAGPRHVAFLTDDRYARYLAATRAAAVVVGQKQAAVAAQVSAASMVLIVPDAAAALQAVLELLAPPIPRPAVGVHPSAHVAQSAKLGRDVAVGPNVVVGERCAIGDNVVLHAGVVLYDDVVLGDGCELFANVVVRERCMLGQRVIVHAVTAIGTDGFGYRWDGQRLAKQPHVGTVVIEDDVEIGSCSCVDRAKMDETRVGAGTKIDNLVQVGHNVRVGRHCVLCMGVGIAGSSVLGDGVVLAGGVGVADHTRIGSGVRVGGMAGVHGVVPDGTTLGGAPAVPYHAYLREQAALRRLPELLRQVKALQARVVELEKRSEPTG